MPAGEIILNLSDILGIEFMRRLDCAEHLIGIKAIIFMNQFMNQPISEAGRGANRSASRIEMKRRSPTLIKLSYYSEYKIAYPCRLVLPQHEVCVNLFERHCQLQDHHRAEAPLTRHRGGR